MGDTIKIQTRMSDTIKIQTRVTHRLLDLGDIDTTDLANGDVIKYNSANSTFYVEERSRISGGSF